MRGIRKSLFQVCFSLPWVVWRGSLVENEFLRRKRLLDMDCHSGSKNDIYVFQKEHNLSDKFQHLAALKIKVGNNYVIKVSTYRSHDCGLPEKHCREQKVNVKKQGKVTAGMRSDSNYCKLSLLLPTKPFSPYRSFQYCLVAMVVMY